jgi:hypothetical protein
VRCARCKTVWFALPPGDPAFAAPQEATAEAAATAQADTDSGELAAFHSELGTEPSPPQPAQDETPADPPAEAAATFDPDRDRPQEPPPDAPAAEGAPQESAREPASEPEARPAPAPAPALSDITIPTVEAPPIAPEDTAPVGDPIEYSPEDVERVAARRKDRNAARRRRATRRNAVPAAILILIMLIAGLIAWRVDVVRVAPQMASLYAAIGLPVNLRGLEFQDVKIKNELHDGVPVLTVEGNIVNTVSMPVEIPRLRFAVRNGAGAEVYTWTAMPSQAVLEPGASLPFRGRLASPPPDGIVVEVRFFTKRDAAAAGR